MNEILQIGQPTFQFSCKIRPLSSQNLDLHLQAQQGLEGPIVQLAGEAEAHLISGLDANITQTVDVSDKRTDAVHHFLQEAQSLLIVLANMRANQNQPAVQGVIERK